MEWKWLWVVLVAFLLGRCCECERCWEQEKIALLQLKHFFTHIEDVKNYWIDEGKQSSDCCQWKRVECNTSTGRVIRLFLNLTTFEVYGDLVYNNNNNNYYYYDYYLGEYDWSGRDSWYLNASLFLPFEELKSLYLVGNSIAGCVDNQGFKRLSLKLDKLEILDLSVNQFNDSILASLSELSSLKSLNLAKNQFTGSNPIQGMKRLSKLNKLETLDLYGNVLGNNILSHLDGFTSLKSLRLQNCGLEGTVNLREFNNLTNLKELYLGQNQIESLGSLFQSNEQLRLIKLEVLGLSENLFNNSIFLSLVVLSNLKSLYIESNKLDGPIHIKELNALTNLVELDIWDNQVNGFVPSKDNETELRLINLEVLDLRQNLFNCSILSSLGKLSNLKSLSLGCYNLNRSINLKGLDALSNLKNLSISCYSTSACSLSPQSLDLFPSLKTLRLYGVSFNGTLATWLDTLSNLENLFLSCYNPNDIRACSLSLQLLDLFPSLKTLALGGFNFYGTLTTQWKYLTNLEELILYYSSLPSNFIQDIGMLASLKYLEVSDVNGSFNFHGPIHLKNLESLVIVETSLENNFLQKIGVMPSLKDLALWDCGLNGTLYSQGFCELENLQNLGIAYNNLRGNLPECFSNLTSLESLVLSDNQFSGNISVLKSLTSLERLDLSSNQFFGDIFALRSLKSLRELSLSNNYFEIPSSLGPLFNLSKLRYMDADNNTIYAETEMHSLAPTFQLNEISISCCGDAGSFPQFLYHQHDLRYVDLSNINLTGEFPNWLLENNTNLKTLVLANNSLLGPFQLPLLSHTDLSCLDISKNSFYGNIPNEIGAKLPSLWLLNMSKNHFGGSIPVSIGDMKSLRILDLSDNKLSGGLPEPLAIGCSSLNVLILSNNILHGQMFSSNFNLTKLRQLQLDGNLFSGRIPDCLSNCSSLTRLVLSNNQLFGDIPRWMGNLSLDEIAMAKNHLEGPIPEEFCQHNLHVLDLSVNNISGNLPSCFSQLHFSQIHLSRNKLQGSLINEFLNSTILVTLDLSHNHLTGNIPIWIGSLSRLRFLLLNNNHFEGGIPVQLCKLSHLSLIDLSNNHLSGTIPPCLKITTLNDISQDYVRYISIAYRYISSSFSIEEQIEFTTKSISYFYKGKVLTYLSGIDLSCNKLIGEITHTLKNIQNIQTLNLSFNSLTGPIPPAISELKQIESLDLSHNNLSGKIPSQLVGLNYLSFFSVAYNNLSGRTPERTAQFATFEESSYLGNPFLCGAPLPNCSTGPSSSMSKASTDNGSIDMNVFYVSFVVSYFMVLLSIACVLYINPYWRRAWFYHIEAGITSCYYFVVDNVLPKRFYCGNM